LQNAEAVLELVRSRDQGRQLERIVSTRLHAMNGSSSKLAPPVERVVPIPAESNLQRIPSSKRGSDLVCLIIGLPILVPLMAAIAVYIKLVSPGPIFYRQNRVGYREQRFQLLKFRSMRVNADSTVHEDHTTRLFRNNLPLTKIDVEGDTRLIPLGGLLRSSGLDELPQVFNVLRREMSLVGPRPCTLYEHVLLDPAHKARFEVLPGITGLWQVSGKNETTYQQMINLDIDYARNRSVWLDLRIMARTFPVLGRQISQLIVRRWRAARSPNRTSGG
jgi:exopolysaccharide production protein ExoY